MILAAFFHDIGHLYEHVAGVRLMQGYGVVDHEGLGYAYLREKGFSEKIAKLVESHVAAKRYLTYKVPDYYNKLSYASRFTLEKQGGRMNKDEAAEFESDELFELFILIRKWDDLAKEKNVPLPSLHRYRTLAFNHLLKQ